MQLCLNVQIPEWAGGLEGQAVYIDTEGSFMSNRVVEMAASLIKKLEVWSHQNQNSNGCHKLANLSSRTLLSNIFYYRCVDQVQLTAVMSNLKSLLEQHKKVI
jgi:RAD51-like protein 2